MQFTVFHAHVVEHAGKQVEGWSYAQLIEERIVAIVCLAYFYRVVAYSASDSEDAKTDEDQ